MKGLRLVPLVVGAAVLALGAAGPTTSEDYAYSTYRELGDRLTVLVDGYPAALHDDDAYIPLSVAVGLSGPGRSVVVTPESFTLLDRDGTAHAPASYREIASNYPKRLFDAMLLRSYPIVVGNQFSTSLRLAADFYPTMVQGGVRIDRVELGPFTWFHAVLYFPRPQAGLEGVLTLRMSGGEEPPIDVRFRIPRVVGRRES
jgi:hypothetical protein